MDNESETGFGERLSFLERCDCGSNPFRGRIALVPISQYPVAKVLIYRAVMLFDNLLASSEPAANQCRQSFTHQAAAERRETYDVRDQQPARRVLDLLDGSFCNRGLVIGRNLLRLSKNKLSAADQDFVLIMKSNSLQNHPLVQTGSVATAQVDQPELADILQLDKRMHSGYFRRVYNESISGSSPHRTIPVKGVVLTVRLQPGALLFRRIHQTVSIKKICQQSKSSGDLLRKPGLSQVRQQLRSAVFGFIAGSSRIILVT